MAVSEQAQFEIDQSFFAIYPRLLLPTTSAGTATARIQLFSVSLKLQNQA